VIDPGKLVSTLKSIAPFTPVPDPILTELIAHSNLCAYRAPSIIFHQGDRSDAVYVVLKGRVQVFSESSDGNLVLHRVLEQAHMFGEMGPLDQRPRIASARPAPQADLLAIPGSKFVGLLEQHAHAALGLAKMLAERLRAHSQLFEDAVFLCARDRLGRLLVEQARAAAPGQLKVLLADVTHDLLAGMLGLHRVTVTNQMRHLERLGFIELRRASVVVLDTDGLEELCSSGASR